MVQLKVCGAVYVMPSTAIAPVPIDVVIVMPVGIGEKFAVIVPGPVIVAIVLGAPELENVIDDVLLIHCWKLYPELATALIGSVPESNHWLIPAGIVEPPAVGVDAKVT